MKNRSYRGRGDFSERCIREVKPGKWGCRIIGPPHAAGIPEITVDSAAIAWRWVKGETDLKFPDPGRSKREKALIGELKRGVKLVPRKRWLAERRLQLERHLLHPNQFSNYAKRHYRNCVKPSSNLASPAKPKKDTHHE